MDVLRAGLTTLLPSLDSIPSPKQLIQLPLALASLSHASPNQHQQQQRLSSNSQSNADQSCPQPSLSCPTAAPPYTIDTCCMNHPSGHFLLAQFWDTQPALGPNDSWTLHGLWPDLCTGGYDQFCDDTRNLAGATIAQIVSDASQSTSTHPGLKAYMDEYWKGLSGDPTLWSHEWNKHGTCVSTLEPTCYGSSYDGFSSQSSPSSTTTNHSDLLDYLSAATTLHSALQSYLVLASHDITPSHTQTYTLQSIESALATSHNNFIATVKCNARHELNEIWLHYRIVGASLRNFNSSSSSTSDIFVPVPPDGLVSNCPASGIKYLPKTPSAAPTTSAPYRPGPTGAPFTGRGHLYARVVSDADADAEAADGCLIRSGVWYTSGTCATYRATTDVNDSNDEPNHAFTLASSFAPCAVLESDGVHGAAGEFVCAQNLPVQSIFGVGEGGVLSWKNGTGFSAEKRPGKFEKVRIFADNGGNEGRNVKLGISWEGV